MNLLKRTAMLAIMSLLLLPVFRPQAANSETVKIGLIVTLTGPAAPWGIAAAEGVRIAADEANAAGGIKVNDKNYNVEVLAYDDQYKASEAISAYNRLVNQDKAKFIFVMNSAPAVALKDTIESDDVLALTSALSNKAVDAQTKHLFRMLRLPIAYVPSAIAWMKGNIQSRRVAIIAPNDETGWDVSENSVRGFEKEGFTVVARELYERSQKDFQALLTKVLALKPDLIEVGSSAPPTAGLIIRQARELGYDKSFSSLGGPGTKQIVSVAGVEATNGMVQVLYADPQNKGFQELSAKYKAKIGQEPNELIVPYYDATNVLLKAIGAAGTIDNPMKVADAFAKVLPMPSLQGEPLTFGGGEALGVHPQILTVNYIGNIKNGGSVVVGTVK